MLVSSKMTVLCNVVPAYLSSIYKYGIYDYIYIYICDMCVYDMVCIYIYDIVYISQSLTIYQIYTRRCTTNATNDK